MPSTELQSWPFPAELSIAIFRDALLTTPLNYQHRLLRNLRSTSKSFCAFILTPSNLIELLSVRWGGDKRYLLLSLEAWPSLAYDTKLLARLSQNAPRWVFESVAYEFADRADDMIKFSDLLTNVTAAGRSVYDDFSVPKRKLQWVDSTWQVAWRRDDLTHPNDADFWKRYGAEVPWRDIESDIRETASDLRTIFEANYPLDCIWDNFLKAMWDQLRDPDIRSLVEQLIRQLHVESVEGGGRQVVAFWIENEHTSYSLGRLWVDDLRPSNAHVRHILGRSADESLEIVKRYLENGWVDFNEVKFIHVHQYSPKRVALLLDHGYTVKTSDLTDWFDRFTLSPLLGLIKHLFLSNHTYVLRNVNAVLPLLDQLRDYYQNSIDHDNASLHRFRRWPVLLILAALARVNRQEGDTTDMETRPNKILHAMESWGLPGFSTLFEETHKTIDRWARKKLMGDESDSGSDYESDGETSESDSD
ncbi:hypothetical protein HK097_003963 [Rhizophlyctis rosea]|uniref:Uncharacterized protein n=1 Tax=Rhizophlyctis rosea TaxID=64517 RepID=A0AAD5S484_9FUNG|nr:hypothetical protein HK097_003963 [Rhizophlyctis rosea]